MNRLHVSSCVEDSNHAVVVQRVHPGLAAVAEESLGPDAQSLQRHLEATVIGKPHGAHLDARSVGVVEPAHGQIRG